MNLKKWMEPIADSNVTLQERLFRLLMLVGLIGMGIAVLMGFAAGESMLNNFGMILGFIILLGITCFSIRFHKIQAGAAVIGGFSCIW